MLYVANDGGYIIKDRVFINRHDILGCPQFIFPTDCFECDDIIAPAIAELLQKGYITKYCCAGHIAPNIDNDAIPIIEIIRPIILTIFFFFLLDITSSPGFL